MNKTPYTLFGIDGVLFNVVRTKKRVRNAVTGFRYCRYNLIHYFNINLPFTIYV